MMTISFNYLTDGKLRVMVRTLDDDAVQEVIHLIDRLAPS